MGQVRGVGWGGGWGPGCSLPRVFATTAGEGGRLPYCTCPRLVTPPPLDPPARQDDHAAHDGGFPGAQLGGGHHRGLLHSGGPSCLPWALRWVMQACADCTANDMRCVPGPQSCVQYCKGVFALLPWLQEDQGTIYNLMGACPQHDLLWEGLTGKHWAAKPGQVRWVSPKRWAAGRLPRAGAACGCQQQWPASSARRAGAPAVLRAHQEPERPPAAAQRGRRPAQRGPVCSGG